MCVRARPHDPCTVPLLRAHRMSSVTPSLRLVRDPEALTPEPPSPAALLQQVEQLQGQVEALHEEIESLRRRDETLRFYMARIDEELRLAARLQQDFLPKSMPEVGAIRFHTMFRPAGYVSGDLYDVMRLDETHIGFFVCDAVGHGMPAALLTMFVKRALVVKEIFPKGGGYRLLEPSETLARLNMALVEQNLSQATYATAIYGVVDTATLEVRFAQGGHPSPVVLRRGGTMEFASAAGALLGIFPDEVFEAGRVQLEPGDRLMIYSDGIEVGFCGNDPTQTHLWQGQVQRRLGLKTGPMLEDLGAELDSQAGSLAPKDDLTIIVMDTQ